MDLPPFHRHRQRRHGAACQALSKAWRQPTRGRDTRNKIDVFRIVQLHFSSVAEASTAQRPQSTENMPGVVQTRSAFLFPAEPARNGRDAVCKPAETHQEILRCIVISPVSVCLLLAMTRRCLFSRTTWPFFPAMWIKGPYDAEFDPRRAQQWLGMTLKKDFQSYHPCPDDSA